MATIRTAIQINDMMSQQFRAMNVAMSTVIDSFYTLQDATGEAVDISALKAAQGQLRQVEANFNQIEQEIRQANEAQKNLNNRIRDGTDVSNGLLNKITAIVGTYLGLQAILNTINLTDEMTNVNARLNYINDGLQTTLELQRMIFDSAQRSYAPFLQTADLVGKLAMNASDAFSSTEETVLFAELLNKSFANAGTNAQGIASATLQLTQALGSGALRGEELNAVLEAAPGIVQNIEKYLNISRMELRKMASDGLITAEIIKQSMFAATNEINEQFENMPITFEQAWTKIQNSILQALTPILQTIAGGAEIIHDNWGTIAPIFVGLATAVGIYVIAMGIANAVTWLSVAANRALIATLLSNPFLWIALLIGIIIGVIYQWIQSVGGLQIAWLFAVDVILKAWDWVKIGFMTGVYDVLDLWDMMGYGMSVAGVGIANMMGDMRTSVLLILQDMVNNAINIINGFINTLNMIPGVFIEPISALTFGTTAQAENEAAKQARESDLNAHYDQMQSAIAERDASLQNMWAERDDASSKRLAEISRLQAANNSGNSGPDFNDLMNQALANQDVMQKTLGGTEKNTKKMSDSIDMSTEDIAYLKDIAERESINRYTVAEVKVDVRNENYINNDLDLDGVVNGIGERMEEVADMLAEGDDTDV